MRTAIGVQPARTAGFNLLEALFGMGVIGMVFLSLYSGMIWSNSTLRLARENMRATQVLVETVESIRVCKWDQVISNGFIPTNFYAPYIPAPGLTNALSKTPLDVAQSGGVVYRGHVRIEPVLVSHIGASYTGDLRRVTIDLTWQTDRVRKSRSVYTYVSRYGIQNYLFN